MGMLCRSFWHWGDGILIPIASFYSLEELLLGPSGRWLEWCTTSSQGGCSLALKWLSSICWASHIPLRLPSNSNLVLYTESHLVELCLHTKPSIIDCKSSKVSYWGIKYPLYEECEIHPCLLFNQRINRYCQAWRNSLCIIFNTDCRCSCWRDMKQLYCFWMRFRMSLTRYGPSLLTMRDKSRGSNSLGMRWCLCNLMS